MIKNKKRVRRERAAFQQFQLSICGDGWLILRWFVFLLYLHIHKKEGGYCDILKSIKRYRFGFTLIAACMTKL